MGYHMPADYEVNALVAIFNAGQLVLIAWNSSTKWRERFRVLGAH